jgi:hypothetical protein
MPITWFSTSRSNFSNNARHAAPTEIKGNNSTLQQQHKIAATAA